MKVKSIVLAVATALTALTATSALAVTDITTGVAAANIYYIAGASAQTPGISKTLANFCNSALTVYADATGKNDYVFACPSAKAAINITPTKPAGVPTGFTGGAPFIVVKKDEGGSFNGVGPVAVASDLSPVAAGGYGFPAFPDLQNCDSTAAVTIPSSILGTNLNGGQCTAKEATLRHPQFGFSDVPNAIWAKRGQLKAADASNITQIAKFAGQGFGVVASQKLVEDLQRDQGLAVGGAVAPSISSNQYASLVQAATTGLTTTNSSVWDILFPVSSAKFNAVPTQPTLTLTWPPATTLTLERRVATSGTQAASDIYFLNNPCESLTALGGNGNPTGAGTYVDSTYAVTATPTTTGVPATNFIVKEESGTGGVKTGVAAVGYAIGVVSLENLESGIGGGARYLQLNGVNPVVDAAQKQNTLNGKYDFAYETELILPKGVTYKLATAMTLDMGDGNNALIPGLYTDPLNSAGALVEGQTNHYTRANNACAKAAWAW